MKCDDSTVDGTGLMTSAHSTSAREKLGWEARRKKEREERVKRERREFFLLSSALPSFSASISFFCRIFFTTRVQQRHSTLMPLLLHFYVSHAMATRFLSLQSGTHHSLIAHRRSPPLSSLRSSFPRPPASPSRHQLPHTTPSSEVVTNAATTDNGGEERREGDNVLSIEEAAKKFSWDVPQEQPDFSKDDRVQVRRCACDEGVVTTCRRTNARKRI